MTGTQSLVSIVKSWKINSKPEYRGFRCANCQKYIRGAWHHQLDSGGYKVEVHFCKNCNEKLRFSKLRFKSFTCDKCRRNMFKSFHVWIKKDKILIETHYCKECYGSK